MMNKESIELYAELNRLGRQMHRLSHSEWHEHGHYREVSRLLRLIADNDGVIQRDLAFEMDVRPSSMTEMLARMEGHGLVERKQDEKDQRVIHVFLTDAGRKLAEESAESMEQLTASMFKSLTGEEITEMLGLIKKLCQGLDTMALPEGREGWHGRHRGPGPEGEGWHDRRHHHGSEEGGCDRRHGMDSEDGRGFRHDCRFRVD